MKRLLVLAVALAMIFGLMAGMQAPVKAQSTALKIGLVTDVGKVDDRGFNQAAFEGAKEGAKEIGAAKFDYIETQSTDDYAHNIQQFVDNGYDVIITVGFLLTDATVAAGKANPKIKFINVDAFQGTVVDNVTGLIFHEEQAGYLAGVLAASMSKSGVVGVIAGTNLVPPVVNYKEGFDNGAKSVNPSIKLLDTYYPGDVGHAFIDPEWGATTAGLAMDQGADVLFGAGGKTGNGALQEVAKRTTKDKPLFCIGVDLDQWDTLPEAHPCLVSSAEKRISDGLVTLIKQISDGSIKGGNFFGTTDIAPFHDFDSIVPDKVKALLKQVNTDLLSGKLTATPPAPAATAAATSGAAPAATMAATASK